MIAKEKKQEIIAKYGRTANDTGSPEVQVALLRMCKMLHDLCAIHTCHFSFLPSG